MLVSFVAIIIIVGILGMAELYCRVFTDINYLGNSSNLFVANAYGTSKGNTPNVEGSSFGAIVYTDGYGFRISQNDNHNRDSAILMLGDSISFGCGVDEDKTFIGLLRYQLADVKIYNSSVIGYSINDYKNVVDAFIPEHKEIRKVYLIYCLNDITSISSFEIDEYLAQNSNNESLRNLMVRQKMGENSIVHFINSFLRTHSKLYLACRENMGDVSLGTLQYDLQSYNTTAFDDSMDILSRINTTLKEEDIDFTVVIPPYEAQLRFANKIELQLPQQMLKQYFDGTGIKYLDTFNEFIARLCGNGSRDLYLYRDAMHLSTVGHKVMYNIILEDVKK